MAPTKTETLAPPPTPLLRHARRAGSTSAVWGYVIVLAASGCFLLSMYTMVVSKLPAVFLPLDGATTTTTATTVPSSATGTEKNGSTILLLPAIEQDFYYCYLVPLTIPITILACYANWVSLKFFRHN